MGRVLGTIRHRLWFTVKLGTDPHRSLQAAWLAHGADQFVFEELERLPDEELAYVREASLKKRFAHWRAMLNATAIGVAYGVDRGLRNHDAGLRSPRNRSRTVSRRLSSVHRSQQGHGSRRLRRGAGHQKDGSRH